MFIRLLQTLLIVAIGCQVDSFQKRVSFPFIKANPVQSKLYFSPPVNPVDELVEVKMGKLQVPEASLNVLLENMPVAEKYSLLLQSYATNIIDNSNRTVAALETMDTLFTEMLSKSIAPSEKSSKLLIDAASTFCSSVKLGKSLQLVKAGGNCKAFGAANGQLSAPILEMSASTLSIETAVPYDDREQEILYAGLVAGTSALWLSLQVCQTFIDDLHPWTTLLGVGVLGLCALDVAIRQGKGIKLASAGLERLVLRDAERETHSDGAAFLVGYLLGLPCFCFRPDVTEALKMLRDDPQGLDFYRQPKALGLTAAGKGGSGKPVSSSSSKEKEKEKDKGGLFGGMFGAKQVPKKPQANPTQTSFEDKPLYALPSIPTRSGRGASESEEILGLSRVLVWLMAPVAAEYLKYGRTVVSDPRRSQKLLSVLEKIQIAEDGLKKKSVEGSAGQGQYTIPSQDDDKKMYLQWAFFEATSLIRQYGDLLEDVNSYLATGTSTVGECVTLVEEELR